MDTIFFSLAIVLIALFWLWDVFNLVKLWGDIESAKRWPSKKAKLIGISYSKDVKNKEKTNIFYSIVRFLSGKRHYNVYAIMNYKGIDIGVYKVSLFKKFNRQCLLFCRKIKRSEEDEIAVYYNPDRPHEAIIMPPEYHSIFWTVCWFGIKTFFISFVIFYIFI